MTAAVRLTALAHGGGCGCKIAPGVLERLLREIPTGCVPPELLVGYDKTDDAAVWRLNETQALIATTDFFLPVVDDPFDFGAIAATNALSDVYAMGGRPILALAVVGMPVGKLPEAVIAQIFAGGASVCREAGVALAGGHSIDCVEPFYGLVALGLAHPREIKTNAGARPGERGDVHGQRTSRASSGPVEESRATGWASLGASVTGVPCMRAYISFQRRSSASPSRSACRSSRTAFLRSLRYQSTATITAIITVGNSPMPHITAPPMRWRRCWSATPARSAR